MELIVSDGQTQTDVVDLREIEVQTDVVVPTATDLMEVPRTKQSIQEELARGLGVDWTTLEGFIEGQKRTTAARPLKSATANNEVSALRPRRSNNNHWSSRISSRFPVTAVVQSPAYFINVFPESTRPYVSSIVASSSAVFIWTLLVYIVSGSCFSPTQHHHHYSTPYSVLVGISDQALWSQCLFIFLFLI